jgi:tetratricopeptide (TPR) repeat protein
VDARETWQALQARLTNARAAFDAGDRARALDEINAALTIDPNFLAAHSLRDRIVDTPAGVAPSAPVASSTPAPAAPSAAAPASSSTPSETSRPAVSSDGYAKFEQRAKRRRVDRRLDAARAALETGRLKAAATALDEVIELDPNLPELPELTATFDDLRRKAAETHRGPRLVAAAVFVVTVLGASWLHDSTSLISRPMIAAAPLAPAPPALEPTPVPAVPSELPSVGTAGTRDDVGERAVPPIAPTPASASVVVSPPSARPPAETTPEVVPQAAPAVVPVPRLISSVQESPIVAPIETLAPARAEDLPDDQVLVQQALQRYRTAYEGLDARSAQAVWPAVNQAALARAFDGLESQSLTFDACDVRVRGEAATATCQGSARYVPKIGSREPRIEPRVWNFSLHKAGGDWKIESARAER